MAADELGAAEAAAAGAKARGAVLRERREALGISLRAFARRCELSPAHVSKVERGLASPSVATLGRMVQELELDPAALFGTASSPRTGATEPIVTRAADILTLAAEDGAPEGSTVRVLASPDAGTVIESFGGAERFLNPTIAPRDSILCVLAGSTEVDVEGERFALGAGDSIVIPPNSRHAVRVTGGLATHTIYLAPEGGRILYDEPPPA